MSRRRRYTQEMVELPEEIIQHIQSFMNFKPAAQASSLCKSWYNAWSTRPVVCFDSYCFRKESLFWVFVKKTVDRYLKLNVKVEKLIVKVDQSYDVASLRKLIVVDAVKLRVNVLEFSFEKSFNGYSVFILPVQVFANKHLTDLYLAGCKVDRLSSGNVHCSKLRSLRLHSVLFKDILAYAQCPILENLTSMELIKVIVADSFFKNLSSTFPKLEDLTLGNLHHDQNIHISSRSVKRLSLRYYGKLRDVANFDLPNIVKFKFTGHYVPPLCFTAASKEWKSEIILSDYCMIKLSKLRDLLMQLRQSKISLHLNIGNVAPERNRENFRLPVVEELTYYTRDEYFANSFFLEYLSCFRPKVVSFLYCSDTKIVPLLYKNLIKQRNQKKSSLSTNYVNKVKVERFEESFKKWLPIKVSLADFDILNHGAERLRFKLKWGLLTPEKTIIKFLRYNHLRGSPSAEDRLIKFVECNRID